MLRKEETNELVKRVTAASLKAIAAEPELNVKFAPGQASATSEEAVLPTPVGTLRARSSWSLGAESLLKIFGI